MMNITVIIISIFLLPFATLVIMGIIQDLKGNDSIIIPNVTLFSIGMIIKWLFF